MEVSASATAFLALLLDRAHEHALAQRIGLAVDANSRSVAIRPDERAIVLGVLDDPPSELRHLRDALADE